MNKRTTRWISLILSLAVMVGSITYLAVGANAEGSGDNSDPFVYSDHDYTSTDGSNGEDQSTNEDELRPVTKTSYSYSKVLDDNISLVEEEDDYDIYFDLFNQDGVNSVTEGEPFTVVVTMENSTAPDYDGDFDNEDTEYSSVDVSSVKFGLLYDADAFELTKCDTNLDKNKVVFTETGSGSSSGVLAEYNDTVRAYEMPYFYFEFTPLEDYGDEPTEIYFDDNSVEVEPEKEFNVGWADPLVFNVYNSGENNTLSSLTLNYTAPDENNKQVSHTAYLNPEFDPEINEYFTTIPANASINITKDVLREITGGKKANAQIQPFTLKTGLNEMNIVVTPTGGGEPRTYTIYIKKLATDTLADPKTVLTKTVEYDEGNITYETINEKTKKTVKEKADGVVTYTISGANDLLAPGNGYVINVPKDDVKNVYNYVIANTANLKESKVTVILNGTNGVLELDGDLDNPERFVELNDFLASPTGGTADPANKLSQMSVDGNKYLITTGSVEDIPADPGDPTAVPPIPADPAISKYSAIEPKDGYSQITLEDNSDKLETALEELDQMTPDAIDNTAAEYVFVADFSDREYADAIRYLLFGYPEGLSSDGTGILGYIAHVKNSLSNDSTAKVTLIALGVDYNNANDADADPANDHSRDIMDDEDEYGLKNQIVNHADENGVNDKGVDGTFALSLVEDPDNSVYDNVYRSQTFTIPVVEEDSLWGTEVDGSSEQNNIYQYSHSLDANRGSAPFVATMPAVNTSNNPRLTTQYNDAMSAATGAKDLLKDAKNPQLIVITADHATEAQKAVNSIKSAVPKLESAIINVEDTNYNPEGLSASSNDFPYDISKNAYNEMITEDPDNGFICDPADNESKLGLIDPINSQIFWLKYADIEAKGYSYDLKDPDLDAPVDYYDALWYLPSIGKYDLTGTYYIVRNPSKDAANKVEEGHYYPISDTVDTKVLGASDTYAGYDNPILDDIPTVAITYDDKYALDIVKGADFTKKDGASPLNSTVKYVVRYANEGEEPLTNVEITDTKILAAKNYKAYVIDNGKNPTSTDKTVTLEFSDMEDTDYPFKGYARLASLPAGKTLYLTYELVVPEVMNVTSGTSGYDKKDAAKIIQSYILENIATGTAKELDDSVMARLDTEFVYDESNGTTSGTTTSTSATSTTTAAPASTVAPYNPAVPTTANVNVPVQQVVVPTGESLVGYIVALSLLFGAVGVFGVTIYGMILDDKIEKAKAAKLASVKH